MIAQLSSGRGFCSWCCRSQLTLAHYSPRDEPWAVSSRRAPHLDVGAEGVTRRVLECCPGSAVAPCDQPLVADPSFDFLFLRLLLELPPAFDACLMAPVLMMRPTTIRPFFVSIRKCSFEKEQSGVGWGGGGVSVSEDDQIPFSIT